MRTQSNDDSERSGGVFATTQWTVVLRAKNGDSAEADEALERLCQTYWRPLYAYVRRSGHRAEDAQDLTQEFLSRLVHKEWLIHVHEQRGKFRSFLLTFLKNFLSDQRDWANAQKRGGGNALVPLDAYREEELDLVAHADGLTADQIFEQRWALAVMSRAAARLQDEYLRRGKSALYEKLKDAQPGEHGEQSHIEIGRLLGMSEQSIKSAIFRMRRRHREILREEIAETVSKPEEIDDEIRHLMAVFSR